MNQPFDTPDINKSPKAGQVDNPAGAHFALFQVFHHRIAARLANLLRGRPFGQDQPVARPVYLNHLGHDPLAHKLA